MRYNTAMPKVLLSASILSADFCSLGDCVAKVASAGADRLHADVMDGVFVPPISFGAQLVGELRARVGLDIDAHLMTVEPGKQIQAFIAAGVASITFHIEACLHAHRLVSEIRAAKLEAGVSFVPSTPVSALEPLLPFVDQVLVMTVNPGWGGQALIPQCVKKIVELDAIRRREGYSYRISVDGGVNKHTAGALIAAGADILVAGSAIFGSSDYAQAIREIREAKA